ncbi:Checkpoint protein rad17 [Elsinoe australis]|uniref:Checkpoint protein rad17 n=1 Tax=Elsinoe australis TaxID=40998 RepID=A0A2P7ZED7_9PEZI|nr:Checkpoint protein rad17 [Elsinoe australis]
MACPTPPGVLIKHLSGQTTHCIVDDFTDPWRPSETIVIQHGFARHAAFWYHWIPVLSRRYRVIRRDLRGHGYSSTPLDDGAYDYSVENICGEILDTLDQFGLKKVHFIGESTSGMLGEVLAAKHPDRLLSLTIISSPTHLPQPALDMFAFGHADWPTACRVLGSRGWGESLSKLPGTVSYPDAGYIKWWTDQVAISSGEGLAGYAEFLSRLDSRPYLEEIRVPMLILAPANSVATKVEEQRTIQARVPGSELVVVNGKGHEIFTDGAEDCQRALLKFLDRLQN